MLTQQDLKLAKAFDGLHRRRHLYAILYVLATAIILMWLLGLGAPFAVTVGPYVFFMVDNSNTYWREREWMYSPIAVMVGWHAPTDIDCRLHNPCVIPGCVLVPWPLWRRLCVNVMLLLPIATAIAFSLFWFVREFVRSASEPSMDPPTFSRDAALAIAFGPAVCITVHVAFFPLVIALHFIAPMQFRSQFVPYLKSFVGAVIDLYRHMPPLLHWPIWSVMAFVALRTFARSRRGVLRPLRGLTWMMLISILGMPFSILFAPRGRSSKGWDLFSLESVFVILVCLLPLFWSLGAIIALTYRWPRLRRKMMGTYCVRCGYDMRGSFAVGHHECPECGEINTPSAGLPQTLNPSGKPDG